MTMTMMVSMTFMLHLTWLDLLMLIQIYNCSRIWLKLHFAILWSKPIHFCHWLLQCKKWKIQTWQNFTNINGSEIVKVYEQCDELKTALTRENQNIDMKKINLLFAEYWGRVDLMTKMLVRGRISMEIMQSWIWRKASRFAKHLLLNFILSWRVLKVANMFSSFLCQ